MIRATLPYQVRSLYQPHLRVPDLGQAELFFRAVFGRESTPLSTVMKRPPAPGHSTDHSLFTMIADVLIESLDPHRYLTQSVQRYPGIEVASLDTPGGWLVDNAAALYLSLREAGIGVTDARGARLDHDTWAGGPAPFYAATADAGLPYALFETFSFPLDPRFEPGWVIPPVSDSDPLGIIHASHHTLITRQPQRALRWYTEILGGVVVSQHHDEVRCLTGPVIELADARFHLAIREGADEVDADNYHAITWLVVDLDRTARHLQAHGVGIRSRTDTDLITEPSTSLGVPWGFTTKSITENQENTYDRS